MSRYPANIITKSPATPTGPATTGRAPGIWRMDEAAYWTRQGLWPNANIIPDQYFPYTTLLLSTTSLGNANNNLFVDSSGAFNPISRNGNTTQGSATPYSTNWSNYFDGTGDYLTQSSVTLGSGSFTVEMWVFLTSLPNAQNALFSCGTSDGSTNCIWYINSSGNLILYSSGDIATTSTTVPLNQWVHLAIVRDGTSVTNYINGVARGTGTTSRNFSSTPFQIFQGYGGISASPIGYASNLRVVVGSAVYTSSFTPPTSALTAISGTSLLTCQSNRFRDASANNYTITRNGDVRVTDFSPFAPAYPGISYNQSDINNWSNYFDGNGDYLTVPSSSAFNYGTGDFTIECWGYRGSPSNFWCAYSASGVSFTLFSYSGASSTIQVYSNGFYNSGINPGYNTWFHVAVTRSSGTLRIFINGVQGFSGSYTTDIPSHAVRIGSSIADEWGLGNVSNLRVVKGTALYTSNFTPPATNLTAVSGTSLLTCQNAAFTDNSTNNFVITPTGNTTVTGNSPFNTVGYWSVLFNGSSNWLAASANTATTLGTGNFTIEGWFFTTTNAANQVIIEQAVIDEGSGNNTGWILYLGTSGNVVFGGAAGQTYINASPSTSYLGQWTHFALVRTSTTSITLYINGVSIGSTSTNVNMNAALDVRADTPTVMGSHELQLAGAFFNGYLSNIRIVKGTAVYTGNFTPPTSPLTAISGTGLLTLQSSRLIDNSGNNITVASTFSSYSGGSPAIQSFDPFYTSTIASNGGSMYFDGSGDYLAVASNAALPTGNARYTIEAWIYPTAINANNGVIGWGTYGTTNAVNAIKITSTQIFNYWWANDLAASFTFATGQWYHIVAQFDGTTRSVYVNGTRLATDTPAGHNVPTPVTNATIGVTNSTEYFTGYIAGAKVTSGAALYSGASYTVPTAPATPAASTSLLVNGMNAGIYDATAINDMETVGNAQVTTAVSKFGGSSVYFDGTGDYLVVPNNAELQMGSGDFTIEFWWYPSSISGYQTPIEKGYTSSGGLLLQTGAGDGKIIVYASGSGVITASTAVTLSTWNHMALVRSGTSLVLYLNGTSVGSATNSTNFNNTGVMGIGANASGGGAGAYPINGYMDDVRITKGYARYTANFTPPTQAFPTF